MDYSQQIIFLKSLGLIPKGFDGIWSNGKYIIKIEFKDNKIIMYEK